MELDLELHYDPEGEWAALYVEGKLNCAGDAYVIEETAFELAGVEVVRDNAFLRGQDQRDGVAPTLDDVEAYRTERTDRQVRAADMRLQALVLIEQARKLEENTGG